MTTALLPLLILTLLAVLFVALTIWTRHDGLSPHGRPTWFD